jgi:SagB-type dehydrogenase family enzyme
MTHQDNDGLPQDIRGYHRRTKHAPNRYALGPAFLDWTSQPSPYRRFEGAPLFELPLLDGESCPSFPGPAQRPEKLDADALGLFFELAFGLSAWKSVEGSTWALRNNPSSGNLHPTESWVVLNAVEGVSDRAGVYHYAPQEHALETRAAFEGAAALPSGGFLLGLTSIPWREAWKYGERAFRYCQLDAGHAIGAAAQSAAALGWRLRVLSYPSDDEISALLGLARADAAHRREPEHPELLAWVETGETSASLPEIDALAAAGRQWFGAANRLSEDHDGWPLVDLAFRLCRKPPSPPLTHRPAGPSATPGAGARSIADVVRARRSAQRFDGASILPGEAFCAMLAAAAPGAGPLLSSFPFPPALALLLFVHRVEGLEPGLYFYPRGASLGDRLLAASALTFERSPVDFGGLSLIRLQTGSVEREGTRLSCLQPIGGKGCFSLAMISDFGAALKEEGGFGYRRLHWEAGLIGQALYLGAAASGFSGTGIGCFFDDEVHGLLGLGPEQSAFQDVYHFTVGAAVEDARILTLPPYPQERRMRR